MKRVFVLGFCLLFVMSGWVWSTGTKEEAGKTEEGPVTISLMHESLQEGEREIWDDLTLGPFEEAHPAIDIELDTNPDFATVTKVQIAAGRGPDLFLMQPPDIGEFVSAGSLVDITDQVSSRGLDDIIYDWALAAGKVNDRVYALPESWEYLVMWYNRDLLEANDWPVPRTKAQFEQVATGAANQDLIPIAFGNSGNVRMWNWLISDYLSGYAGMDALRRLLSGEIEFTHPTIMGVFETMKEHWEIGWINEGRSHEITRTTARSLFYNQNAVLTPEGAWFMTPLLEQDLDFDVGVNYVPAFREGLDESLPVGIGGLYGVNTNTEYVDQSIEFLDFLYKEEELMVERINAGSTPLPRDYDEELLSDDLPDLQRRLLSLSKEAAREGKVGMTIWGNFPGEIVRFLPDQAVPDILLNDASIEPYMEEAQQMLDEALETGWTSPFALR